MAPVIKINCPAEHCNARISIGFDRLLLSDQIVCYVCGTAIEINNRQEVVESSQIALAAIKALSKTLNECTPTKNFVQVEFTAGGCAVASIDSEIL